MQISNLLRNTIVITLFTLICYALIQGMIYGSWMGIVLAAGSMAALFYCNRLMKKLQDLETMEDEQLIN